ncbi:hypothetical protein GGR30_000498 [Martelella radicis]|uniref:Uncharacterized protein n=1 Tax=Martelella radicis TaxID=1397476 RepID=A0A7W6KG22_9HYPH|nr:hypothetical protein [Martelella radicis]
MAERGVAPEMFGECAFWNPDGAVRIAYQRVCLP